MNPMMIAALANQMGGQGASAGPSVGPAASAAMPASGGGEMSTSIKYLLIGIAVLLAGFFGWRAYKNWKDKKTATSNNELDTKLTAQDVLDSKKGTKKLSASELEAFYKSYGKMFSAQLRAAFNPSGMSWLISTDTTKTKEVLAVADKMKQLSVPFKYVAGAYYEAYKDDLNLRLQSELSTSELKDFYGRSGLQGLGIAARIYANMPISGIALR